MNVQNGVRLDLDATHTAPADLLRFLQNEKVKDEKDLAKERAELQEKKAKKSKTAISKTTAEAKKWQAKRAAEDGELGSAAKVPKPKPESGGSSK